MTKEDRYDSLTYSQSDNEQNHFNSSYESYYADPAYLDRFLKDCILNTPQSKSKTYKLPPMLNLFIFLVVISIFIFASITNNTKLISFTAPIFFVITFILIIISTIISRKLAKKFEKNINLSCIDDFFSNNTRIHTFNELGESFCLNNGATNTKKSPVIKISTVIFSILSIIYFFTILGIYNNNKELFLEHSLDMGKYSIPALFGLISIGFFSYGVIGNLILSKICSQRVDAVCVQLDSKIVTTNETISRYYKPIYYTKYNGYSYILFKKSWSTSKSVVLGDYTPNMYLNPNNPFEYMIGSALTNSILFLIFGIPFLSPIIITFISVI